MSYIFIILSIVNVIDFNVQQITTKNRNLTVKVVFRVRIYFYKYTFFFSKMYVNEKKIVVLFAKEHFVIF